MTISNLSATSIEQQKTVPPRRRRRVSLEAYFRSEEKGLHKHEYHNGIVTRMPGGTSNHSQLSGQVITVLNNFVFDKNLDYIVTTSDLKIRIDATDSVVYPDAAVIAERIAHFDGRKDVMINPLVVVEVLSKSTQKYDRENKFELYRTIPTFKEYVMVHQNKKHIIVYTKQNDNTWNLKDYIGDDTIAILHHLHDCPIPLARLYRGLELE